MKLSTDIYPNRNPALNIVQPIKAITNGPIIIKYLLKKSDQVNDHFKFVFINFSSFVVIIWIYFLFSFVLLRTSKL